MRAEKVRRREMGNELIRVSDHSRREEVLREKRDHELVKLGICAQARGDDIIGPLGNIILFPDFI